MPNAIVIQAAMAALAVWNLLVFFLYARDKRKAQTGRRRTPEKTLLACALLLGGVGAFAGVFGVRHKTKHAKFYVLVPLAALLTLGAFVALVVTYYSLLR